MTADNEAVRLGIVPLRPLGAGDIVEGTVQAMRRNPGALLGAGLVVAVVTELIVLAMTVLIVGGMPELAAGTVPTWDQLRPLVIGGLIAVSIAAVGNLMLAAVVNVVVPRAVFGHTVPLGAALAAVGPKVPRLLGVFALMAVIIGGFALAAVLGAMAGPVGVLLMLPALAGTVYVSVALAFAQAVVMVEGLGPVAAVRRSRALVHAVSWWRVFGYSLVVAVAVGLAAVLLETLFAAVSGGSAVATSLSNILITATLGTAGVVVTSLLYVDHRCRSEGVEGLWREAG